MTVKGFLCIGLLLAMPLLGGCGNDETTPQPQDKGADTASQQGVSRSANPQDTATRIISLGGPVTEIIYALGAEQGVVAIDISSTYPPAAQKLPKVGYQRTLSAENILALRPTMVLASSEAGPPTAITQIKAAGVPITIIPTEHSVEGAKAKIRAVASALNHTAEGERLCTALDSSMAQANKLRGGQSTTPSVLFIYARGAGAVQASGTGTAADAMIALGGGKNAISGYDGYKPLTPEAAVAARPDLVLMTTSGLQSVGGIDGLLRTAPGLAETPAGRNRRIVALDDELLLGFGPRLGDATLQLAELLHTGSKGATP